MRDAVTVFLNAPPADRRSAFPEVTERSASAARNAGMNLYGGPRGRMHACKAQAYKNKETAQ